MSRALAEQLEAENERLILDRDRAEAFLSAERKRVAELTGEIIRMRREGFVPQPEPPTPEPAALLPQAIQDAIMERAANAQMARELRAEAERLLRAHTDENDIVKAILEGEDLEEAFV